MTHDPIDVSPQKFGAASSIFGAQIHGELGKAISGLPGGLANTAAMAGSDPGGTAWADNYDKAAKSAAQVLADLDGAASTIAVLLEQSGFNHGMAEAASDPRQSAPTPPDTTNYDTPAPAAPAVPSAKGGSSDPSPADWIVDHTVHYVWVNGDPAKLRAAGQAWGAAATAVEGAGNYLPAAFEAIYGIESPEKPDVLAVVGDFQDQLKAVADACRDLANGCTEFANQVDQAHEGVKAELAQFLIETAAIQVAGAVLTAFTFGGSEVGAQIVEAERVTALAARVSTVIEKLATGAKRAADAIGLTVERFAAAGNRLATIRDGKPVKAAVEEARRMFQAKGDATKFAVQEARDGLLGNLKFTQRSLQHGWEHKGDWGFDAAAKWNGKVGKRYQQVLDDFVHDTHNTVNTHGLYHKQPATLIYSEQTNMCVVLRPDGSYWTGWRLSPQQLQNVVERGSLGGGR